MACIDITVPDMLRLTEAFRSRNESAYIILIASLDISPVLYMKPGIHAESLILKPFHKEQAEEVLREAFSELLRALSEAGQGEDVRAGQSGRTHPDRV